MNKLFLSIEDFYADLHNGEFDEPFALAAKLQSLSDAGWDEVEELYQAAICIEG